MIIKTRKLPATSTEGERMRATASNGATLTLPYPYALARLVSPYRHVAVRLAKAMGLDDHRLEHVSGHTFKISSEDE